MWDRCAGTPRKGKVGGCLEVRGDTCNRVGGGGCWWCQGVPLLTLHLRLESIILRCGRLPCELRLERLRLLYGKPELQHQDTSAACKHTQMLHRACRLSQLLVLPRCRIGGEAGKAPHLL